MEQMSRIGFAYNQKPDSASLRLSADADPSRPAEEISSRRRKWSRRSRVAESNPDSHFPAPEVIAHHLSTVNDKYAEWDCAETIDAVEDALGRGR